MDKAVVAVLGTAAAGGLIGLQAPINSMLGKSVGTFAAATISFALGTIVLVAITLLFGSFGEVGKAFDLPWYYLIGGILGAIYVTTVLVTVRELGAGGVTAATIAGQLAASVVIDRAGLLGLEERALTGQRIVGIALLALGTYLVVRD